jgi:hypothetical protein
LAVAPINTAKGRYWNLPRTGHKQPFDGHIDEAAADPNQSRARGGKWSKRSGNSAGATGGLILDPD